MANILDIRQISRSRSRSRSPGGASHSTAQSSFLRMFGFIMDEEEIGIETTAFLSQDTCEDLAIALQHKSYHDHPSATCLMEKPSRDWTFTEEEFDSYQTGSYELLRKFQTVEDPQQLSLLQEELKKLRGKFQASFIYIGSNPLRTFPVHPHLWFCKNAKHLWWLI